MKFRSTPRFRPLLQLSQVRLQDYATSMPDWVVPAVPPGLRDLAAVDWSAALQEARPVRSEALEAPLEV